MSDACVLHLADCRDVMRGMPDNSVHAIVSDPPYGYAFMGAKWDSTRIELDREVWTEALRVLTPGGHVLASGSPKLWHWMAVAMEMAGFEPRDSIAWIQGQGMPHGRDISKAIDKAAGAEREVVASIPDRWAGKGRVLSRALEEPKGTADITAPATPEAEQWAGWNTALAPSHEPIVVMRKPLSERTVEANVLRWGTGALNVDGCRLPTSTPIPCHHGTNGAAGHTMGSRNEYTPGAAGTHATQTAGRWPPNVALNEAAAAELDARVGKTCGANGRSATNYQSKRSKVAYGDAVGVGNLPAQVAVKTGPSAFFFTPKASTSERDRGCDHLRWMRDGTDWRPAEPGEQPDLVGNCWPTVKPVALMRWLVRLACPPGGLVLDPFLGSGTTGVAAVREGFRFVGADSNATAHAIASARIRWAEGRGPSLDELPAGAPAQASMF